MTKESNITGQVAPSTDSKCEECGKTNVVLFYGTETNFKYLCLECIEKLKSKK